MYGGYVGKLWNVLEQKLGFRTEYRVVAPDVGTGTENNGSWNGVVGMVVRGEVDVALELYSMTSKRLAVVDFSSAVYYDRFYMFVRRLDGREVGWKGLVAPFDWRMWMLLVFLAVVTFTYLCFARLVGRSFDVITPSEALLHSPVYIACCIFGILFCSQGHATAPRCVSWRAVLIGAHVAGVVLAAAYSGRLVASITVRYHRLPFASLEGLLATDYRLGVKKDSAEYNVLQHADGGPMRQAFATRVSHDARSHPVTDLEGLRRLCSDARYAFVTAAKLARHAATRLNCSVAQVPEPFMQGDGHLALAPGRPYARVLDHYLRRLRGSGVMQKLFADAFRSPASHTEPTPSPVDLPSAAAAFQCLAAGAAAAAALLGLELALALRRPRGRAAPRRPRRHVVDLTPFHTSRDFLPRRSKRSPASSPGPRTSRVLPFLPGGYAVQRSGGGSGNTALPHVGLEDVPSKEEYL
ncbi:glutamate receptor ionotropic, delta-1-like [Bacillus rossius redtenbacheri]|uniref:glutamate receptor ionotropic, delta-1-like n=1 Tax=Bacillus rossius redtenbacheri TaxID=93214 RepID=UPI002FDD0C9D